MIRFANPAAITALGYDSADNLLGRHRHETIHYKHPGGMPYPAADCPMQLPRTTGETVARDLDWFFRRDGSTFPVSYVSLPIELGEGRGAVVAFAGIEDRMRGEQMVGGRDAVLGAREDSLRRIAALVAGGAASGDVFAAIAREVAHVVGLPLVLVWRFDPGKTTATVIGEWSEVPHSWQAGTHWPLDGPGLAVQMLKTGRPARIDDYAELPGTIAAASRETRLRGSAGAPIIVDGDMWGWMAAADSRAALPDHIEDRLAEFTELVATAISNTESRAGLSRLAEEQAALRRVATLVARGIRPEQVFAAVANEVGRLLSADLANVCRYESDGTLTFVASASERFPVGSRWPIEGHRNLATLVLETGAPARLDNYADATGPLAEGIREDGIRSVVGDADPRRGPPVGLRWPPARARSSRCRRIRRRVSAPSRSSWRRRSRTPKRGRKWRRRGRGSWRRPTRSAVGSSGIFMTARSSGWCTPSSRSSWHSARCRTARRTPPPC